MYYNKKLKIFGSMLAICSCLTYADTVRLTIINNSGHEMSADLIKTDTTSFAYNFKKNTCATKFTKDTDNSNILDLPVRATILVSIDSSCLSGGARLYVAQGAPSVNFNNGMSGTPGVPDLSSYQNVYDVVDMGWTNNGLASWNVNAVDFFGIGFQLSDGSKTIGFNDDETRQDILDKLSTAYNQQRNMYDTKFFYKNPATQQLLRIFSPQHFWPTMGTSWDKSIDSDLNMLVQDKNFTFKYGGFTYTNLTKLSSNTLGATCSDGKANKTTCSLSGINTINAIGGQIAYSPKSGVGGAMASTFAGMISAVINRGVLGYPNYWGSSGDINSGDSYYPYWYVNSNMVYNPYGKVLTSVAINNKINDASYEDFWNMANSLYIGENNNNVNLVILPFGKSD